MLGVRFQSPAPAPRRVSRAWTLAVALGLAVLPAVGIAESNAVAPRGAALCVGVADPAAEGIDRSAADVTRLGASFRKAGFAPVIELTGGAARRDAILAALFRLRAGTRPGDLTVVVCTGPVRVESEGAGDRLLFRSSDAAGDADDLSLRGTIAALAAGTDGHLVLAVTGLPCLGRRGGAAGPWRLDEPPPAHLGSFTLLLSGGRGETTEFSGTRTLLAANLAAELDRALERHPDGVPVADWLRAASRRVVLESGTRQTPELLSIGDAASARILPPRQPVLAAPPETVPELAEVEALANADRMDEALRAGLLRTAVLLETDPGGDMDACLALLDRIALASGRVDLAMIFASERLRRTPDPAAHLRLTHTLGRLMLRSGHPAKAAALHRGALDAADGDGAAWAWLADALDRAGDTESAQEAAGAALDRFGGSGSPEEAEARAIAHEVLGRWNLRQRKPEVAKAQYEKALEGWRAVAGADRNRLALILCETGEARLGVGDAPGAAKVLEEAIALWSNIAGAQASLARARMLHGDALAAARQPGAVEAWQAALANWTAAGTAPPAQVLVSLGEALAVAGRAEDAYPLLTRAIAGADDDAILLIRAHRVMSRVAIGTGDLVTALKHAQMALAAAAGPPPAAPAEVAGLCADLASLHLDRGEAERAIEYGNRAVAERQKAGLTNDAAAAAAWIVLGRAHEGAKAHAPAAAAWSNAVVALMQAEGANAQSVAAARTREGRAWLEAGNPARAAETFEAARLVYKIRTTAEPAARADNLLGLGEARELAGSRPKAREALEAAVAATAAGGAACDGIRALALLRLARISHADGRLFDAKRQAAEALEVFDRTGADKVREAAELDRMLTAMVAPQPPQGSYEVMPAFTAAEADYKSRRADGTPR